jgi:hypothetical protein
MSIDAAAILGHAQDRPRPAARAAAHPFRLRLRLRLRRRDVLPKPSDHHLLPSERLDRVQATFVAGLRGF